MPKAENITTTPAPDVVLASPRRRALLGGVVALLAGAVAITLQGPAEAAAAPTGADADLLAACQTFFGTHTEMKDPHRGGTEADDEALAEVMERWYENLAAVVQIPARTPAGQRAKLHVIYTALDDAMDGEDPSMSREEFATLVILRELLGDAVAAVSPDNRLTRLADEIMALDAETDRITDEIETIPDLRKMERARREQIPLLADRHFDLYAELASLPATTLAGFRAKARVAQRFNSCAPGLANDYQEDAMEWSLANDLLGVPSVWAADEGEVDQA